MNTELEILKKKYDGALQMAMNQADAIFTLNAQLSLAQEEIAKLNKLLDDLKSAEIPT